MLSSVKVYYLLRYYLDFVYFTDNELVGYVDHSAHDQHIQLAQCED